MHATQALEALQSRCQERVFPSAGETCIGNAWILNSVLPLFSLVMGKFGRCVLENSWNVKPLGSRTAIHVSTVQSMLVDFFNARPALGVWDIYFESVEEIVHWLYSSGIAQW